MKEFNYEELLKATESFSSSRMIGKGSHGCIYKGILEENDSNNIIAIKKSSSGGHEENSKLDNERRVLSSIKECPNVIKFLGTCKKLQDHPNKNINNLLVMEYMPNGSLHNLLHLNKTPPSWSKRIDIALQVAQAIKFLHEEKPMIIHRDIKSENVLFDQDWNAKLADFGLAIMTTPNDKESSLLDLSCPPPAGTMGYIDPCYTTPSKLSTKVDVFSYGVVLLEILSGRKAIDVSKSPASIVDWAVTLIQEKKFTEVCDERIKILPSYMESNLKNVLHIAARCISLRENCRPCMREIVSDLQNLSCSIKRVRIIPIWTSLLRSMMLFPKRPKLAYGKCTFSGINASRCTEEEVHDSDISRKNGRLLLKEILADVTLR